MGKVDPDAVVRLYEDDLLPMRDIAGRLGTSYGTVQRIVSTRSTPRPAAPRPADSVPCGSKRAYQRHIDRGEEPDELCKQASRDYANEFNRHTGAQRARNRAYRRLAKQFSYIFEALLIEERDRADGERSDVAAKVWSSRTRERAHRRLAELQSPAYQAILAEEKAKALAEVKS